MLPPPLAVSPAQARRFMLQALGLVAPFPDVGAALAHHGYVQLDPINVCGRMHDLILRNRVAGYREGDLLRHLYGDAPAQPPARDARQAFEHYAGVLVALPLAAWPFLAGEMQARTRRRGSWWGKLTAKEEQLAQHILETIGARGPSSSDDIEHDERALTAWNSSARLAKVVLEKLFAHGRVLIATRRNFRRVYDLPERVVPDNIRHAPPAPAKAAKRWRVLLTLRQRRLVRLSRSDAAIVADAVQPVRVESVGTLYCLREDVPLFERAVTIEPEATPRLLAPLDPLIYDRVLTRKLWDFSYTWEVYTPPARRVRGYFALPVLVGDRIVGDVDPKADRDAGRLRVVSRRIRRGVATAGAVTELARFLGLRG